MPVIKFILFTCIRWERELRNSKATSRYKVG